MASRVRGNFGRFGERTFNCACFGLPEPDAPAVAFHPISVLHAGWAGQRSAITCRAFLEAVRQRNIGHRICDISDPGAVVGTQMKVAGIVIAVAGAIFAASTFLLGVAMDDLKSKEGILKFLEGVGVWSVLSLFGVALFAIGSRRSKDRGLKSHGSS
jgi:hypothetical protein